MARSKKSLKRGASKRASNGLSLLNLKVTDKDRRKLNAQAKKYTNGNISAWLRLAGSAFKPAKRLLAA